MTAESRSMTSKSISEHQISIIHAVCHVMGMVSACANPIIYGFFNENFHREFSILYNEAKKSLCCLCTKISSNTLVMSPGNGQDPQGNGRNGKTLGLKFFQKKKIFLIVRNIINLKKNQNNDLFISPKWKNTILEIGLKSFILSKHDH